MSGAEARPDPTTGEHAIARLASLLEGRRLPTSIVDVADDPEERGGLRAVFRLRVSDRRRAVVRWRPSGIYEVRDDGSPPIGTASSCEKAADLVEWQLRRPPPGMIDMADDLMLELERRDADPDHPMHAVDARSTAEVISRNGFPEEDVRAHLGDRYRHVQDVASIAGDADRSAAEAEVVGFVIMAEVLLYPAVVTVDRSDADGGERFVDVEPSGSHVPVSYRSGRGWGLYATDRTYGDRPTEIHENKAVVLQRVREKLDETTRANRER